LYIKQDRQYTYKPNTEARSRNDCCRGKEMGITHSECVLVELSYPAANAHETYCHPWPVWVYHIFPLSHKRYHFRGKKRLL